MKKSNSWVSLGFDAMALGLESFSVVGLRSMKIAAGGATANAEAGRMVTEKLDAAVALQSLALSGQLGFTAPQIARKTINHYRRKVQANQRRLSGS